MNHKKIISYVCYSNDICDIRPIVGKLESELPFIGHSVKSLHDLFPLLADVTFHTDFIAVYVEDFYKMENVDSFKIIQTLDTLIKCTVHRPDQQCKPIKRNTKIIAVISSETPIDLIKDILEYEAIAYITPSGNGKFTYDDLKDGIRNFLESGARVPQSIKKMLKTKLPAHKVKNTIMLTPRQKQILDLVSNRGASNKIIAKTLNISESTVKLHMGAILKKYNVRNRTQLAVFSNQNKSLTEV